MSTPELSHPNPTLTGAHQIDPNGAEYKQRIAEFAAGSSLRVAAPELQCGDALLWSSLTIHGSLATTAPDHSRRSFTAHYIPFSDASVGHHGTRSKEQRTLINGVDVILHGDHSRTWLQTWTPVTRAHLQSRIPWLYRGLRAIKRHALG